MSLALCVCHAVLSSCTNCSSSHVCCPVALDLIIYFCSDLSLLLLNHMLRTQCLPRTSVQVGRRSTSFSTTDSPWTFISLRARTFYTGLPADGCPRSSTSSIWRLVRLLVLATSTRTGNLMMDYSLTDSLRFEKTCALRRYADFTYLHFLSCGCDM